MKLVNRVSRRIRSRDRKRPAVHLNFELCEDRVLLTNYLVNSALDSNTGTANNGTLRYVINQLDASTDATNTIDFDIPGPGVQTINPASPLPPITVPVVINGYTQPGAKQNSLANGDNAVLLIELNGANAPAGTDGLLISAGGSTVEGLAINGFVAVTDSTSPTGFSGGDGIELETSVRRAVLDQHDVVAAGGNTIQGNFIGTDALGATGLGNQGDGVLIDGGSGNNTIGGTTPAARNVISGNQTDGIGIYAPNGGGSGNLILGNFIGTNAAGTAALGNTLDGISLNDASNNRIIGNVVSGNGINQDAAGINLESNDRNNIIARNEIGTNAAGDAMLGNSLHGIFLGNGSSNNTIGGPTDNDRNVISGNGQFPVTNLSTQGGVGVYIYGANTSGNVVQGNFIGTNASGDNLGNDALTNSVIGVLISQSFGNTVQGNLISGNRFVGLEIAGGTASGNLVQGNLIGTNAGGTGAIPNGQDGITINDAPNNTIGGTAAGAGNLISGNGSVGIDLFGLLTKENVIEGNALGLNSANRLTLPNRKGGIFVNTGRLNNNKIGGTAPGQANRGQSKPL